MLHTGEDGHQAADTATRLSVGPPIVDIRRGTFRSVKDLIGAISRFIDGWNDRCEPFIWTKTADQILDHSRSQKTSFTRH